LVVEERILVIKVVLEVIHRHLAELLPVAAAAVAAMVHNYQHLEVAVAVLRTMTPVAQVQQIKAFVVVIVVAVEVAVVEVQAHKDKILAARVAVKEEQGFHLALRDQP
jgi:hypothetical protein